MKPSAPATPTAYGEMFSLRRLIARNKLAAAGVAAVVVLLAATIVVAVVGSRAGAVSDSTTCTQWGSANQNRQAAYARLYLREHGPLRSGGTTPASVIAAINGGCARAYADDVSDTTTVVQAISGQF